ncbi:MAG TPA: hypothetical protein DEO84_07915 [candidate division Zixibacteria bacterium]|nr:hypothetical protein [candidate division Zixibacteria bacterium]
MNCKEFRKQIDLGLVKSDNQLSAELEAHVVSCPQCTVYLNNLSLMQKALNETDLVVRPGELDDINFEKIISMAPVKAKEHKSVRIAWPFKWLLAPAIVAAAAVLIFLPSKPVQNSNNSLAGAVVYSTQEIENTILSSDSLGVELLASLAGDNIDLDNASDELLRDSDINDILNSMSADELNNLYEKIDNLKG